MFSIAYKKRHFKNSGRFRCIFTTTRAKSDNQRPDSGQNGPVFVKNWLF